MQLGDRDESVDGHELAGRRIYEVFHARIRAGKWPAERHVLALRRPLVRGAMSNVAEFDKFPDHLLNAASPSTRSVAQLAVRSWAG